LAIVFAFMKYVIKPEFWKLILIGCQWG